MDGIAGAMRLINSKERKMDNYDRVDPEEIIERLKRIIEKLRQMNNGQPNNEKELPYTYSD